MKPALAKWSAKFVEDGHDLLMEVPSVLIPEESNYLLNLQYADAAKVKLIFQREFSFDHRVEN